MAEGRPRVFNITPDAPFLEVLASAVLGGFPREPAAAPDPLTELPRWTILLPTRRAVRELERIFVARVGGRGMLLPRIRPIGDIEEDLLTPEDTATAAGASHLPEAISAIGRELVLITLIDEWARDNPQTPLAQEIAAAPSRGQALAASLAEFIDGLETEEIDAARITGLFGLESARHREAILDFLALARTRLPALLKQWNLCGIKERQSQILRHEARRLAANPPAWPVIAAGSTGSIPATRDLLRAISRLPNGAVILPGLDTGLDDESWQAVGPQHPQFILKQLLAGLDITRGDIAAIASREASPRNALAREFMRPPETTDSWRDALATQRDTLAAGLTGLSLVETASRQEESLVIALMLREALETPGRTASLITPDRDLARRVKQDLKRWAIDIDDSAGEPLINFGGAAFAGLLLDAIDQGFTAEALNALFKHPLCTLGFTPEQARRAAEVVELGLFRRGTGIASVTDLAGELAKNRAAVAEDSHAHPSLARIGEDEWARAGDFLTTVARHLAPVQGAGVQSFSAHFTMIVTCLEAMAGPALWADDTGDALRTVIAAIAAESHRASPCPLTRVTAFLRRHLSLTPWRPQRGLNPRLSILGLLEARLMRADLHILGGLNEGIWPAFPDSGPWLNRPMRETLGLQQPERSIGQTAHDFLQALGADEVRLVWSRRVGDSPVIPSRWVLRLRMMAQQVDVAALAPDRWTGWTRRLDAPGPGGGPCRKPRPAPPVAARPKRLSVTQIETLIRDPYAIYARHVLRLEPLDVISSKPGPALRGTLIHDAIGDFFQAHATALPADAIERLMAFGRNHFEPHFEKPLIAAFWWPRFQRMARWLIEEEVPLRSAILQTHAETGGALEIETAAGIFRLTCRADRIDVLRAGTARIVDYKTGRVPSTKQVKSGLSPQLPLEAAILAGGGFKGVAPVASSALVYIRLGGGDPPGVATELDLKEDAMVCAARHLQGLTGLLDAYASPSRPYLPRAITETTDAPMAFDHLSRFREWVLAGEAP